MSRERPWRPALPRRRIELIALIWLAVAVFIGWVIYRWLLLPLALPTAEVPGRPDPVVDSLAVVQTTTAVFGLLAIVLAGVYAYRRQHLAEVESYRADGIELSRRYESAAEQLGSDKPAIRLAGAYAMARLADDWLDQRQTCIDVLCAYLRMPVAMRPRARGHGRSDEAPTPNPHDPADVTSDKGADPLLDAGDVEVRRTIQRLIVDHLSPATGEELSGARLWNDDDVRLDFTGATLYDWRSPSVRFPADTTFSEATFSGGAVFDGAEFPSRAMFHGAAFSDVASFGEATFCHGGRFDRVAFSGGAMFRRAAFSGGAVFRETTFSRGAVFDQAEFSSGAVFDRATFFGGAMLHEATFSEFSTFIKVSFMRGAKFVGATFSGDVMFEGATFSDRAWFERVTFSGSVHFVQVKFFRGAGFNEAAFAGEARFDEAAFAEVTEFYNAVFANTAEFHGAKLTAGVSFAGAEFQVSPDGLEGLVKGRGSPSDLR